LHHGWDMAPSYINRELFGLHWSTIECEYFEILTGKYFEPSDMNDKNEILG
jgi:hypothetical protein